MSPDQFAQLASRGFNRIPVIREVLADLDTPLSAYIKLADNAPYSYLLESVQGGEKWGRYSIIGLPAREILRVNGYEVSLERDGVVTERETVADPLAWIEDFQARYHMAERDDMPRFTGGLVGYFGFDTIRYIEPRLARGAESKPDPIGTPDILLMVSEEVVVFDNLSGKLSFIVHVDPAQSDALERAEQRLDELETRLRSTGADYRPARAARQVAEQDFRASFTQQGYEDAVERIKHYIVEGDVMQVVPSQRMSIPLKARPLDVYRALRSLNPSPYMYFLDLGNFHIVGSSPEILARLEGREVTVRPIAGTRPRGRTEAEDRELERELLADPKELAEHLMLIDLGRNDAGRVSETGSVKLVEQMVIERYSHVMHIVSHVTGQLKPGLGAIDVLRATFPAGTVSGAPKIRALEIIDELEPVKRGVYSGAVGYLGWSGNMDTAIAIRTAVVKDGELHIQAGGGIVYDSVPATEWEETLNKRRAMFSAVALAEAGLDGSHR
jgi:anthranilate synthase component 1